MIVASIDPGLDLVAAAIFDTTRLPARPQMADCGRAFERIETMTTGSTKPIWERLADIAAWPQWLKATHHVGRLVIEEPRIVGAYARNRAAGGATVNPQAMSKFWMALGALLAGAERATVPLELLKALKVPKTQRALLVNTIMGKAFAQGPKGGKRPDAIDATFLGLWALSRPLGWRDTGILTE